MSRCTEHTRRVLNPKVVCCRCQEPLRPGDRYRQCVMVNEDFTEKSFQRLVAHSYCVGSDKTWELFEDPPRWKTPPLGDLSRDEQRVILHSLGMGTHIRQDRHGYRNGYCAGAIKEPLLETMVEKGLMVRGMAINDGENRYYHVSKAGGAAVGRPDRGSSLGA